MANGRLLNTFLTVGGFLLLQERSYTARTASLAEEEMSSNALQLLLGLLCGLFLSPKNKEVKMGRMSPCGN